MTAKRNAQKKKIFTAGLGGEINQSALQSLGNAGYRFIDNADQLEGAFEEIQRSIQDDANSFYWVNYASPKRGNAMRNLIVSLKGNTFSGPNSVLSAQFNSDGFSDVERGVFINRTVIDTSGVTNTLALGRDESQIVRAITVLPLDAPRYAWTVADPSLATLTAIEGDGSRVLLVAAGRDGTTTLTARDTVNTEIGTQLGLDSGAYTRVINLVIGAGGATQPLQISTDSGFGFSGGQFGFNVSSGDAQTLVIEGSEDLVNWFPLHTGSGSFYFADPQSANAPSRYYRLRLQ